MEKISYIMEIIYAMYISSYFNANEKVENETVIQEKVKEEPVKRTRKPRS